MVTVGNNAATSSGAGDKQLGFDQNHYENIELGGNAAAIKPFDLVSTFNGKQDIFTIKRTEHANRNTDESVDEISSLLANMLLNTRRTWKSFVRSLYEKDLEFSKTLSAKSKKTKKALEKAYDRALTRVEQHQDKSVRLAEIAKLACLNYLPEAEVWVQRGNISAAKAKCGRKSASRHCFDAESAYVRAYTHYADLKRKFTQMAEMNNVEYTDFSAEIDLMEMKMAEMKPKVYEIRARKHVFQLLDALKGKFNPGHCLTAIVSLSQTLAEFDTNTQKPYQAKAVGTDMTEYLEEGIQAMIQNILINTDDLFLCKEFFDAVNSVDFINCLDALYWSLNRAQDYTLKNLGQEIMIMDRLRIEEVIHESRWKSPVKDPLAQQLADEYSRQEKLYRNQQMRRSSLNDVDRLYILDNAKESLIRQKHEKFLDKANTRYAEMSAALWRSMLKVQMGVVEAMSTLSQSHLSDSIRYNNDNGRFSKADSLMTSRDNVKKIQARAKISHSQCQRLIQESQNLANQDFLTEHDEWDAIKPENRNACHTVICDILTGEQRYPRCGGIYDPKMPNKNEFDIRDEIGFDLDLVEDMSLTARSTRCW